jgi:hypothetical protein
MRHSSESRRGALEPAPENVDTLFVLLLLWVSASSCEHVRDVQPRLEPGERLAGFDERSVGPDLLPETRVFLLHNASFLLRSCTKSSFLLPVSAPHAPCGAPGDA